MIKYLLYLQMSAAGLVESGSAVYILTYSNYDETDSS